MQSPLLSWESLVLIAVGVVVLLAIVIWLVSARGRSSAVKHGRWLYAVLALRQDSVKKLSQLARRLDARFVPGLGLQRLAVNGTAESGETAQQEAERLGIDIAWD
ncbi:MAG: hypothetical protein LKJ47_01945 [Bifidobacteriaceae bacterium]|jgi:hypothetical protein|nr:hypothetical protein [Bifidobacteriaceae bacterium]